MHQPRAICIKLSFSCSSCFTRVGAEKVRFLARRADRSSAAAVDSGRSRHCRDHRRSGDDCAAAKAEAAAGAPFTDGDSAPEAALTGESHAERALVPVLPLLLRKIVHFIRHSSSIIKPRGRLLTMRRCTETACLHPCIATIQSQRRHCCMTLCTVQIF